MKSDLVMPGPRIESEDRLRPGIHDFERARKTWMAGVESEAVTRPATTTGVEFRLRHYPPLNDVESMLLFSDEPKAVAT